MISTILENIIDINLPAMISFLFSVSLMSLLKGPYGEELADIKRLSISFSSEKRFAIDYLIKFCRCREYRYKNKEFKRLNLNCSLL